MYVNNLCAGSVHFLAGRPCCGKTKCAIVGAIDVACLNEYDVIIFSLQHEKTELLNMISARDREKLLERKLNVIDTEGISVEEIVFQIDKILEHSKCIFCVIDELPLVSCSKAFRYRQEEIQYIITELREYAVDKNVAILATLPISAYLPDSLSREDALRAYAPAEFWMEQKSDISNGKAIGEVINTVSFLD